MRIPAFKTAPSFHSRPWGGRAMADRLHKKIPDGPVGESWEVSAHPNGLSRVAGGPFAGMSLAELTKQAGADLLGDGVFARSGGEFPILVKLIDVNSLASVQVHPDDEQARRLEGFPRGKTEAWYIIERSPEARFFLGMAAGVTPASFRAALADGRARGLLASPEVAPGDCLFVPPGTIHACGEGVLLLEVQQSCDITYRVYDWDRVDESGKRRELHLEKALQVIDFSARPSIHRAGSRQDALNPILACGQFDLFEARLDSRVSLPALPSCATGTLVEGSCRLVAGETRIDLGCGDSFVVPARTGAVLEDGPATVIVTVVR
jgi:mannose-6-phosphate isomerase